MNTLDIILAIFLIYGLFEGFRKGFLVSLAMLVGLVAGIYGGIYFSGFAAGHIARLTDWDEHTVNLVAFAATFIAIVIAVYALARTLTKIANIAALGMLNKLLGAVFGLTKMAFLLSVVLLFLNSLRHGTPLLGDEHKQGSQLYPYVQPIAPAVLPEIIREIDTYLENQD